MTHNTREVEEFFTQEDEFGYSVDKAASGGDLNSKEYVRELLTPKLHHQLQKAREEEREKIMRWTSSNYSRSTQPLYAHVDLLELQNFIRQPDQSELDQPISQDNK